MDPISNILCTIRNGISAKKTYVSLPYGKIGWAICHVLYVYGYIHGMEYNYLENTNALLLFYFRRMNIQVTQNLHGFHLQKNVCIYQCTNYVVVYIVFMCVFYLPLKVLWQIKMLLKKM